MFKIIFKINFGISLTWDHTSAYQVVRANHFVPWFLFVQETLEDLVLMTQWNQVPQEDQEDQTQAILHFPSDQVNPESLEETEQTIKKIVFNFWQIWQKMLKNAINNANAENAKI